MIRVRDTGVHRADRGALRFIIESHTLCALVRINDVDLIAFTDGFVRAFRLAGSACDALFCDLIGHLIHLLKVNMDF